MLYLITKALVSGVIIMAASEAAKRSPNSLSPYLSFRFSRRKWHKSAARRPNSEQFATS
jgi:hypothetical protein